MGIKMDGLDKLQKQLKKMEQGVKEIEGNNEVPMDQLLNVRFMRKYTKADSFDDFLTAGGFAAQTNEEFGAIPQEALDDYTRRMTNFSSWEDMLGAAAKEYITGKNGALIFLILLGLRQQVEQFFYLSLCFSNVNRHFYSDFPVHIFTPSL